MQKIPFSLAKPGMVLAKDVTKADNPNGPPICGKGLVLTESLIERLAKMDIRSITVQGHQVRMEGEKTLDEDLEALERRFRFASDDPLTEKLRNIYRACLIRSRGE